MTNDKTLTQLSDEQARQLGLNLISKILFTHLANHDPNAAWPSIRALAAILGTNTRTIVRSLHDLRAAGLIEIQSAATGNRYRVVEQPAPPAPVNAAPADKPTRLSPRQRLRRACVATPRPKTAPQAAPASAPARLPLLNLRLQFSPPGWSVEMVEEQGQYTAADLVAATPHKHRNEGMN